jgi:D-lactate dehydrogenase (cytochrome)
VSTVYPRSIDDVVAVLQGEGTVLAIGAQSSLTGGAMPMGELVLATSRMTRVLDVGADTITVEPGVTVEEMQQHLSRVGAWFPPAPTFTGACAGGIVATNAAGAATFKYGSTRAWVEALTVVLADGTVLDIERGTTRAVGGAFDLPTRSGVVRVRVPAIAMPNVPKCSAGYYAAPGMDLVDLFVGSEGTLGVIVRVRFRALAPAPARALAWIPCPEEAGALRLVEALRRESQQTWRTQDRTGIDVSAIEHLDARSLALVAEDGIAAEHNVNWPAGTAVVLLAQLELDAGLTPSAAFDAVAVALTPGAHDGALTRLCRLLADHDVLDATELVLPGDRRQADLIAVREAVPAAVNQRVAAAQRDVDPRIQKTAADMIVPFDHFAEMMRVYRVGFASRGLDYAVWGHISDGNVHPNVIPRSYDDVLCGRDAILEFGRAVTSLGGSPLAEHGVGRSPIKQALLRQLYGEEGIAAMRAVKRALDPQWRLAPGVIFPAG